MAINKISGNILQDNLVRGANLAVQGNLIYFDIINNRVGIKVSEPQDDFNVAGIANVGDIRITSSIPNGVFYSSASSTAVTSPNLTFDGINLSAAGNVVGGGLVSNGTISAIGNATFGNVFTGTYTGTTALITGALSAGNISTTGLLASGNIRGANLNTSGIVTATSNITGGNINSVGTISAAGNVIGMNITAAGSVNASTANLGNLTFSNTTVSTSLADGNITLTPTGNSLLVVNSTTGITIPVGNTAQRPTPVTAATMRYNMDTLSVEVYNGVAWTSIIGEVTNQVIYPDGFSNTYNLNKASTAAATLIAINGVVQLPNVAYTITGTTLILADVPLSTDIIDIRFL